MVGPQLVSEQEQAPLNKPLAFYEHGHPELASRSPMQPTWTLLRLSLRQTPGLSHLAQTPFRRRLHSDLLRWEQYLQRSPGRQDMPKQAYRHFQEKWRTSTECPGFTNPCEIGSAGPI